MKKFQSKKSFLFLLLLGLSFIVMFNGTVYAASFSGRISCSSSGAVNEFWPGDDVYYVGDLAFDTYDIVFEPHPGNTSGSNFGYDSVTISSGCEVIAVIPPSPPTGGDNRYNLCIDVNKDGIFGGNEKDRVNINDGLVTTTTSSTSSTSSTSTTTTTTTTVPGCAVINLTVTDVDGAGPSGRVDAAGDVITYSIVLSNASDPVTGISLSSPLLTGPGGTLSAPVESISTDGILVSGETWTYTGTYTVSPADIADNGGGDGDIDCSATVNSDECDSVQVWAVVRFVSTSIPTLNEWGMIILGLLLAGLTIITIRKQRNQESIS